MDGVKDFLIFYRGENARGEKAYDIYTNKMGRIFKIRESNNDKGFFIIHQIGYQKHIKMKSIQACIVYVFDYLMID
ncbi:MAG: hypothetical protein ACOCP4_00690 [Candidatus Woesearchaeota archaeon]